MNAGPTTVDGIPPSCGGYTPDWGKPYGFWKTLGFGLAIYCITIYGAMMIVQLLQAVVAPVLLARFESALMSAPDPSILENGLPTAISSCTVGALGIALISLVIHAGDAPANVYFGRGIVNLRNGVRYIVLTVLWFIALQVFVALFAKSENFGDWTKAYAGARPLFLLWVGTVFLGPLFEEMFHRGFLFAGFRHSAFGVRGTIVLTSVFFAATHYNYGLLGVFEIFLFGLFLGVARYRSDTIALSFVMHVAWNLMSLSSYELSSQIQ